MPVVDLNVDFETIKDADVFEPLPDGTYEFMVASCEAKTAKSGRPMLKWTFRVLHEGKQHNLFYNTVLPYMNKGELDLGGVGMLVAVCKALGKPWTGSAINTDDYLGSTGMAEIYQKPKQSLQPDGTYADDPSGIRVNDIKKFVV